MSELYEAMVNAIIALDDLTFTSIDHFGAKLLDCFPGTSYQTVTINGKDYQMKTTIELTEI